MASFGHGLKISDEVDRISNLPDSVLCLILCFLRDTKESVRTCILSKRWKFLWTNVPRLSFNDSSFKHDKERFEKFVTMVLLLHKSQHLGEFWLMCEVGADPFNVTAWISTAIARDVKALTVSVDCKGNKFITLPSSLFACRYLEFLQLYADLLVQLPSLVSLPRLKRLHLDDVQFECDESFRKLIHGCSVLKYLHITRARFDNVTVLTISSPTLTHLQIEASNYGDITFPRRGLKLEINAPLLESFHLADYVSEDCTFQSLMSLLKLHLYNDLPYEKLVPVHCCRWFGKLVEALHRLDFLTLGFNMITWVRIFQKQNF